MYRKKAQLKLSEHILPVVFSSLITNKKLEEIQNKVMNDLYTDIITNEIWKRNHRAIWTTNQTMQYLLTTWNLLFFELNKFQREFTESVSQIKHWDGTEQKLVSLPIDFSLFHILVSTESTDLSSTHKKKKKIWICFQSKSRTKRSKRVLTPFETPPSWVFIKWDAEKYT